MQRNDRFKGWKCVSVGNRQQCPFNPPPKSLNMDISRAQPSSAPPRGRVGYLWEWTACSRVLKWAEVKLKSHTQFQRLKSRGNGQHLLPYQLFVTALLLHLLDEPGTGARHWGCRRHIIHRGAGHTDTETGDFCNTMWQILMLYSGLFLNSSLCHALFIQSVFRPEEISVMQFWGKGL